MKKYLIKQLIDLEKDYGNLDFFKKNEIEQIEAEDLTEIYGESEQRNINIYIMLESNYIYYLERDKKIAAYLSFLISFYLFVLYTPPRSEFLAMYYIDESIKLDSENEEYKEFRAYVLNGN